MSEDLSEKFERLQDEYVALLKCSNNPTPKAAKEYLDFCEELALRYLDLLD